MENRDTNPHRDALHSTRTELARLAGEYAYYAEVDGNALLKELVDKLRTLVPGATS